MKNKLKLFLYYIGVRLNRGVTVSIRITHRCNLKCEYCHSIGKIKPAKDMTLEFLQEIIKKFPVKIKQVYITGGEPTLNKEVVKMVDWLTAKGIYVAVFTNLSQIVPFDESFRLRIKGAYHSEQLDKHVFEHTYNMFGKWYGTTVDEIGKTTLSYSKFKPFFRKEDSEKTIKNTFRIGIDGMIFCNCFDGREYYFKEEFMEKNYRKEILAEANNETT